MERGARVATRAAAIAREAGARDVEAEATIFLGLAASHLGSAEAGLDRLRSGLRVAVELDMPVTALRGYIRLSDVLKMLGRHAEAAQEAAEGLRLAGQLGMARTLGCYLIANQALPFLRLGQWAEADRLTAYALRAQPERVFGGMLHMVRAELGVMRGMHDEAATELQAAWKMFGEDPNFQFAMPLRFTEGMIALARGDLAEARAAVAAGLVAGTPPWKSRYAWPLLWLGMRVEADEATGARDRRVGIPVQVRERCDRLAGLAAGLVTPAPHWRGYRVMVAAERPGPPARANPGLVCGSAGFPGNAGAAPARVRAAAGGRGTLRQRFPAGHRPCRCRCRGRTGTRDSGPDRRGAHRRGGSRAGAPGPPQPGPGRGWGGRATGTNWLDSG